MMRKGIVLFKDMNIFILDLRYFEESEIEEETCNYISTDWKQIIHPRKNIT
jgi:hypothetical protein